MARLTRLNMSFARFAKFNAVGALGILVQLGVVGGLLAWTPVHAAAATAAGISAAVVHNFAWHRRWTWADRPAGGWRAVRRFAEFAGANGTVSLAGGLAVTLAAMDVGVSPVTANAVAIVICGVVNYGLSDRVVFR